jgi:type III secretion protein S
MDAPTLITFLKQGLVLTLLMSMPTVVTIAVIGLVVALVQAVTQVQEQAIGFGIKLIAAVVVIALTSQWMGAQLLNFVDAIFIAITGS